MTWLGTLARNLGSRHNGNAFPGVYTYRSSHDENVPNAHFGCREHAGSWMRLTDRAAAKLRVRSAPRC